MLHVYIRAAPHLLLVCQTETPSWSSLLRPLFFPRRGAPSLEKRSQIVVRSDAGQASQRQQAAIQPPIRRRGGPLVFTETPLIQPPWARSRRRSIPNGYRAVATGARAVEHRSRQPVLGQGPQAIPGQTARQTSRLGAFPKPR